MVSCLFLLHKLKNQFHMFNAAQIPDSLEREGGFDIWFTAGKCFNTVPCGVEARPGGTAVLNDTTSASGGRLDDSLVITRVLFCCLTTFWIDIGEERGVKYKCTRMWAIFYSIEMSALWIPLKGNWLFSKRWKNFPISRRNRGNKINFESVAILPSFCNFIIVPDSLRRNEFLFGT